MKTNHLIRSTKYNRKHKTRSYTFIARQDLWDDIERIADNANISIAHFLREAARRNVAAYKNSMNI